MSFENDSSAERKQAGTIGPSVGWKMQEPNQDVIPLAIYSVGALMPECKPSKSSAQWLPGRIDTPACAHPVTGKA